MSNFRQQQTTINDAKVLEATLVKMGYKPSITGSKQEVRGHYQETRTADIILKQGRSQAGWRHRLLPRAKMATSRSSRTRT
jgi:hypothetical protein